jgi:2-amino-4-hydroxy-6-hydroxymethyldihydropteridine diphosphokinase
VSETPRATAYVGLGSNVGAPQTQVARALRELEGLPDTRLIRHSSLYETEPVGLRNQPGFINAVAIIETGLSARALLDGLLDIEQRHGRVRTVKNGPRTLDLDILLYGDARIGEDGLTIPHPRMHERGFVLEPLLEIDADCEIPGLGRAAQYREQALGQGVRKIGGAT